MCFTGLQPTFREHKEKPTKRVTKKQEERGTLSLMQRYAFKVRIAQADLLSQTAIEAAIETATRSGERSGKKSEAGSKKQE